MLIHIRCHGNSSFGLYLSDTSLFITLSQDLATSVISIPRVDLRRNSENGPSRDLEDPFHKRVEMKLRALSDRMDADRTAASSRSASYQPPPERAMTSSRSAYQDRLAISSRSSVCQNTSKALAPSKLAAQASHKFLKGVQRLDGIPREIFVSKGSSASRVASCNSSATGKSSGKILVAPSSSQVGAKTSRSAQVILPRQQNYINFKWLNYLSNLLRAPVHFPIEK